LASVRRTDATSWQIVRLAGVTCSFQVIEYSVEPSPSILARNLLAKEYSRSARSDESEPLGPEVTFVGEAEALAGRGNRLAWTTSTPHVDIVGPACVAERSTPDTETAEEMALSVAGNVCGLEISDRSFIDDSWCKVSSLDQVAGPLRDVWIDIVIERSRQRFLEHERPAINAEKT
jgi:hypothetical protein